MVIIDLAAEIFGGVTLDPGVALIRRFEGCRPPPPDYLGILAVC